MENQATTVDRKLLTRKEAAESLAVCDRTIDLLIRRKKLRAVRIGKSVRIDPADLDRLIEQQKAVA